MAVDFSGPWDETEVGNFLDEVALPVRLSCIAADGFPRVVSLWFQYRSGVIYSITHQSAKLVAILKHNHRVGFEISADAPPYHGVRGQGTATLQQLGDDPVMEQLLERYLGDQDSGFSRWLLSRKEEEYLIVIRPHRLFSWDYRQRMTEVV
jgi:nitroimidazol reductase NimA-like FMN-containing flavoprotein (pyridoxamine 5'-phosphate oxidase superfamily)